MLDYRKDPICHVMIGDGTYSKVFAHDAPYQHIAIKCIKNALFESAVKEIAFVMACNHPNIIKWCRLDFTPRSIQLLAPRYPVDLAGLIVRRPTARACLQIATKLAKAVSYLHTRGIIHCDLKPSNILCAVDTDGISIIICDFGISCMVDEFIHTAAVQTVHYRAPEVNIKKSEQHYDKGIDIWSLGCIMYEIAMGEMFNRSIRDDTTVSICEMFNTGGPGKRCDRIMDLRGISNTAIFAKICSLMFHMPRNYRFYYENNYMAAIAGCLRPNPNRRLDADDCCITLSAMPAITDRLHTQSSDDNYLRRVDKELLDKCSTRVTTLAKSILSRYCITEPIPVLTLADEYAALFMSLSIFSGSAGLIKNMPTDRADLLGSSVKIILRLNGHIF